MLRIRMARNQALTIKFLAFCNLHSISTCCALLRHFLGRLGGWGSPSVRPRSATSNSLLQAAVVVSPSPLCTISPETNRRVRGPMPQYLHRACQRTYCLLPAPNCKRPHLSLPARGADTFFPFNAALSKFFLNHAISVSN